MLKELFGIFDPLWVSGVLWVLLTVLVGFLLSQNKRDSIHSGSTAKARLTADLAILHKEEEGEVGSRHFKAKEKPLVGDASPAQRSQHDDPPISAHTDESRREQLAEASVKMPDFPKEGLLEYRPASRDARKPKVGQKANYNKLPGPADSPTPDRKGVDPDKPLDKSSSAPPALGTDDDYRPAASPVSNKKNNGMGRCSLKTVNIIKRFEGFSSSPYLCDGKVYTIGFGSTKGIDGKRITRSHPAIDKEAADELLRRDLFRVDRYINSVVRVKTNDDQWSALCSLVYNIGPTQFGSSTLLKKLNRGDYSGTADQFPRWVFAGRTRLRGLAKRRKIERALFLGRL